MELQGSHVYLMSVANYAFEKEKKKVLRGKDRNGEIAQCFVK